MMKIRKTELSLAVGKTPEGKLAYEVFDPATNRQVAAMENMQEAVCVKFMPEMCFAFDGVTDALQQFLAAPTSTKKLEEWLINLKHLSRLIENTQKKIIPLRRRSCGE